MASPSQSTRTLTICIKLPLSSPLTQRLLCEVEKRLTLPTRNDSRKPASSVKATMSTRSVLASCTMTRARHPMPSTVRLKFGHSTRMTLPFSGLAGADNSAQHYTLFLLRQQALVLFCVFESAVFPLFILTTGALVVSTYGCAIG